jgi:peptidoglycan/xylan/chitin deacetylase (PgdA/CDA1 family)
LRDEKARLPAEALAHNFTRGDLSRPRLLLSFDGGSEASAASSILDTLEREGVRTTLFLTGEFIRNQPDLVYRILARGHEIGNHTARHRHFTTWESNRRHDTRPDVDRAVLLGELEGARQALLQVAGVEMAPFWRSPYGEVNGEILLWAAQAGYLHVGWSPGMDSLDWVSDPASRHYRSPQEFLSVLTRKARGEPQGLNGTIILMHLHSNRPWADRFDRHLGETIRWLRAAGYDLVPASSLAGITGVPGSAYRPTASPAMEGW